MRELLRFVLTVLRVLELEAPLMHRCPRVTDTSIGEVTFTMVLAPAREARACSSRNMSKWCSFASVRLRGNQRVQRPHFTNGLGTRETTRRSSPGSLQSRVRHEPRRAAHLSGPRKRSAKSPKPVTATVNSRKTSSSASSSSLPPQNRCFVGVFHDLTVTTQ